MLPLGRRRFIPVGFGRSCGPDHLFHRGPPGMALHRRIQIEPHTLERVETVPRDLFDHRTDQRIINREPQ